MQIQVAWWKRGNWKPPWGEHGPSSGSTGRSKQSSRRFPGLVQWSCGAAPAASHNAGTAPTAHALAGLVETHRILGTRTAGSRPLPAKSGGSVFCTWYAVQLYAVHRAPVSGIRKYSVLSTCIETSMNHWPPLLQGSSASLRRFCLFWFIILSAHPPPLQKPWL